MILIHTALLCEAQTFIERLKLKKTNSSPKIYSNETIIVAISGVGKENTISTLQYVFDHFTISKAYNIGVAGIGNSGIKIGELFSVIEKLDGIKQAKLISVDRPKLLCKDTQKDILYDMEGNYFLEFCLNYLDIENISIFKIVSDHLSDKKLSKDFIKNLIAKHNLVEKHITYNK